MFFLENFHIMKVKKNSSIAIRKLFVVFRMFKELSIFQKTYDFLLWFCPAIDKFPKSQKYVLGEKIKESFLRILRLIIEANALFDKKFKLKELSTELDCLRILIRLSKDLNLINIKKYKNCAIRINEIGRMLGGWLKSVA